jgi:hypothetical protein
LDRVPRSAARTGSGSVCRASAQHEKHRIFTDCRVPRTPHVPPSNGRAVSYSGLPGGASGHGKSRSTLNFEADHPQHRPGIVVLLASRHAVQRSGRSSRPRLPPTPRSHPLRLPRHGGPSQWQHASTQPHPKEQSEESPPTDSHDATQNTGATRGLQRVECGSYGQVCQVTQVRRENCTPGLDKCCIV